MAGEKGGDQLWAEGLFAEHFMCKMIERAQRRREDKEKGLKERKRKAKDE